MPDNGRVRLVPDFKGKPRQDRDTKETETEAQRDSNMERHRQREKGIKAGEKRNRDIEEREGERGDCAVCHSFCLSGGLKVPLKLFILFPLQRAAAVINQPCASACQKRNPRWQVSPAGPVQSPPQQVGACAAVAHW